MKKKQVKEFMERLNGKAGCNFRLEKKEAVWTCSNDFRLAKTILKDMKISKEEQVALFKVCRDNGGHCDCEILLNAEEKVLKKYK